MERECIVLPNINLGFRAVEIVIKEGTQIELKNILRNSDYLNIRNGFGHTPLMIASKYGYTDKVRIILDCGANPDLFDNDGNTALMISAKYNRGDIIKLLIDAKADLKLKNFNGQTVYEIADYYNSSLIIDSNESKEPKKPDFKILSMF